MKHLKRFNESKFSLRENLQEFCDTYIAYLYDVGFNIDILGGYFPTHILQLNKPDADGEYLSDFYWKDIESDFIAFIEMLQKKYNLRTHIEFLIHSRKNYESSELIKLTPAEIVSGASGDLNHTFEVGITSISIYVTGKK